MNKIWNIIHAIVFGANVLLFCIVLYAFLTGIWHPDVHHIVLEAQAALQNQDTLAVCGDVISYAVQTGKLDMVSIALTVFGGSIALFGFVGFWLIRSEALEAAKCSAQEFLKSDTGKMIISNSLQHYIQEYVERHQIKDYDGSTENDWDAIARNITQGGGSSYEP